MKTAAAFFKLIRYPNLIFIALTQFLFYEAIVKPAFLIYGQADPMGYNGLLILISASVLIASGGYVINDYFDLNIDRINKPERLVVDQVIKRRWAILWHLGFSLSGLILSFILAKKTDNFLLFIFNIAAVVLLWFYSTTFKKQLLIGNIIISLLTAWVILVLYVTISPLVFLSKMPTGSVIASKVYKFAVLYGGFAFMISLIREAVKDMEDIDGDQRYGCKTMPIVWGIGPAKIFVAVWITVLIASLVILQLYGLQVKWWWSVVYTTFLILTPLVVSFKKLLKARDKNDFRKLSMIIKWVMFSGIVSMLFFKWYV